jgi:hypothetical protein
MIEFRLSGFVHLAICAFPVLAFPQLICVAQIGKCLYVGSVNQCDCVQTHQLAVCDGSMLARGVLPNLCKTNVASVQGDCQSPK